MEDFDQYCNFPVYKQKNINDPEIWFDVVLSFYREAENSFSRRWNLNKKPFESLANEDGKELFGEPPEVWKTVGDEVLFSKKVDHPIQVVTSLYSWIDTLGDLGKLLIKPGLNVKSSAWIAEFPVRNSEVILRKKIDDQPFDDAEMSHVIANFILLKEYQRNRDDYVRDFIGPSIDTGFRLGAYASVRKLAISIELAYILGVEGSIKKQANSKYSVGILDLRPLTVRYGGRVFT